MSKLTDCHVSRVSRLVENTYALHIEKPSDYSYEAGQYCFLSLKDDPSTERPYSIANAPHEESLEFHIKDAGNGLLERIKEGDLIAISHAQGTNCIVANNDKKNSSVFIGGGTGYAPLRAMIQSLIEDQYLGEVELYLGVNDAQDYYMEGDLSFFDREINDFKYRISFESESGLNICDLIQNEQVNFKGKHVYIAGPPAMIKSTIEHVLNQGGEEGMIHYDQTVLKLGRS